MEVKKKHQFIREYWPTYKARSLFLVVAMQILTSLVVGCSLLLSGIVDPLDAQFWIMIIAILGASIGINVLVFGIISEPLKMLTYALAHASGETTHITPLNINAPRFEKNGLKPLLIAIYESDSNSSPKTPNEEKAHAIHDVASVIQKSLDQASTGIGLLDKDGSLFYANKSTPVRVNTAGHRELDLIFDGNPDLTTWLMECREHSIHATKVWKRIANKLTGEEGRRLYDIVASYEKGSEIEVVVTLFERTDDYLPEDNDLDFIAFAAHELRGPITVIRGYLDTLNDELENRLANDEQVLFDRLVVSANRLSGYINNILNAAKYDRRHMKVHLREESLAEIYSSISDDMSMRATSQNRVLQIDISDTLPTVAADQSSISEVIGNLVDNAIKYSNEGGVITVNAQAVGDKVEVSVSDRGIGMPSNVMSNLFTKFYRSHRSRETVAGSGIGLYICKAIVESHGGTISVRSVEGEGSTFVFSLPVYAVVAEKLKAAHNSNESFIEENHDGWIKNHGAFRG